MVINQKTILVHYDCNFFLKYRIWNEFSFYTVLYPRAFGILTFYRITRDICKTFITGVACRQGTFPPSDTWSHPIKDWHIIYLLISILFLSLSWFPGLWTSGIPWHFYDFIMRLHCLCKLISPLVSIIFFLFHAYLLTLTRKVIKNEKLPPYLFLRFTWNRVLARCI